MRNTEYDPEVYEELEKKLNEIEQFCYKHSIPIFITYANEHDNKTEYGHRVITPLAAGVRLSNDRITKYNASLNEQLLIRFKQNGPQVYAGDLFDAIIEEDE